MQQPIDTTVSQIRSKEKFEDVEEGLGSPILTEGKGNKPLKSILPDIEKIIEVRDQPTPSPKKPKDARENK